MLYIRSSPPHHINTRRQYLTACTALECTLVPYRSIMSVIPSISYCAILNIFCSAADGAGAPPIAGLYTTPPSPPPPHHHRNQIGTHHHAARAHVAYALTHFNPSCWLIPLDASTGSAAAYRNRLNLNLENICSAPRIDTQTDQPPSIKASTKKFCVMMTSKCAN